MRIAGRPGPVETFQIKKGRAKIAQFLQPGMVKEQAAVRCDVVRNELSKDRKSSKHSAIFAAIHRRKRVLQMRHHNTTVYTHEISPSLPCQASLYYLVVMLSAAKNLRASLFLREDVDSSLRSA